MQKKVLIVSLTLGVLLCILALALQLGGGKSPSLAPPDQAALEQAMAQLRERLAQVESERDSARQQVNQLQLELAALVEKGSEDQQVIKDLWAIVTNGPRPEEQHDAKDGDAKQAVADSDTGPKSREADRGTKYDIDSVKEMLAASGGDLEAALHQIVTTEGIDKLLEQFGDRAAYWAAAASLAADPQTALAYLEEASKLHPNSAAVLSSLVSAQIAADQIDESTLEYLSQLQSADPTNALGDCYEAYVQFENGDVAGALQALSQASDKGRFADDRISMLMARYDYLLDAGATDSVALGLSAFSLPLEHLGMIQQVRHQAMAQVETLSANGQYEEALAIARDVSNLGRTVSSSGRFLIHDRVGIALEQAGLSAQISLYQELGDLAQMQRADSMLGAAQERTATIDTMIQGFATVMANMTEDDLAGYVDSTILNGEFATLQNIPEIAAALNTTPAVPPDGAAATATSD
ncbi:MAG: tetratricopeptide repeat protein [Planctomycetota bacterium]|jgi:tetratricopeptide (TPR) repeat protein